MAQTYEPGAKVILGGQVIIDLTQDTVLETDVASGKTFHKPDGSIGTGSSTKDVDSSGCTATVAEVLSGKTFAKGGSVLTGTMANQGEKHLEITDRDTEVTIPLGYHDGSGGAGISTTEKAKIIPGNIKAGVVILGQTGTYSGESISVQTKTATPTLAQQTILPDSGYDYLSQVTVNPIPVTITAHSGGGLIYSIG